MCGKKGDQMYTLERNPSEQILGDKGGSRKLNWSLMVIGTRVMVLEMDSKQCQDVIYFGGRTHRRKNLPVNEI